jgi:hypothetical protein
MAVAFVAIACALPRAAVKSQQGKPCRFGRCSVCLGLWDGLALGTAGFGVIATFITFFYDAKGWDGAAFALTLFSWRLLARGWCSRTALTVWEG